MHEKNQQEVSKLIDNPKETAQMIKEKKLDNETIVALSLQIEALKGEKSEQIKALKEAIREYHAHSDTPGNISTSLPDISQYTLSIPEGTTLGHGPRDQSGRYSILREQLREGKNNGSLSQLTVEQKIEIFGRLLGQMTDTGDQNTPIIQRITGVLAKVFERNNHQNWVDPGLYDANFSTQFNEKGYGSLTQMYLYANLFFENPPNDPTGYNKAFWVQNIDLKDTSHISATPDTLPYILDQAPSGSKIFLDSGTYSHQMNIVNDNISIQPEDENNPPVFSSPYNEMGALLLISGSGCHLKNLDFQNVQTDTCISSQGKNTIIENCRMENIGTGIHSMSEGLRVQGLSIDKYRRDGIIYLADNQDYADINISNAIGSEEGKLHQDAIQGATTIEGEKFEGKDDPKVSKPPRNGIHMRNIIVENGYQGITLFHGEMGQDCSLENIHVSNVLAHPIFLPGLSTPECAGGVYTPACASGEMTVLKEAHIKQRISTNSSTIET